MKVGSHDGINVYKEEEERPELSLPAYHVKTQQKDGHLQARKKALTRTPICRRHDLGLPSL